jgi:hypothetical protein
MKALGGSQHTANFANRSAGAAGIKPCDIRMTSPTGFEPVFTNEGAYIKAKSMG